MPTEAQIHAGAVALAKAIAPAPWNVWSEHSRAMFEKQARAVLEAAERVK